ncbi:MAG: DUF58 domain-containing protein [Verrucomicrobiales bacterium]|nr:DUF58 domain-containing protein [Verrucomicrobiales bacterium]
MQQQLSEILRKVRKIELITRGIVREAVGGEYHSVFKGQGIDFDDFREYQPGDEVRSIDWNVTARMGFPYIKKFVEEREMTVFLAVDVSGSQHYGGVDKSKREIAAELAGVFAFSANANQDKVGLLLVSDEVEEFLPATKGSRHVLRVIRDILWHEPHSRGTNLAPALERLTNALTRRALVVLISDFQTTGYERALRVCAIRHDVVAIQLTDPCEMELPDAGLILLEDAETGELLEVDTSKPANRTWFRQARAARQAELDQTFKSMSIDKIDVVTNRDYLPALHSFFKRRAAKA